MRRRFPSLVSIIAFVDTSTSPTASDQRADSANPRMTARWHSPEGDVSSTLGHADLKTTSVYSQGSRRQLELVLLRYQRCDAPDRHAPVDPFGLFCGHFQILLAVALRREVLRR